MERAAAWRYDKDLTNPANRLVGAPQRLARSIRATLERMKPRRVVVLLYPEVELLDVAGPTNVLTAASRLVPARPGYVVELAAARPGRVPTAGGVELHAGRAFRSLRAPIDTLLVPGGMNVDGVDPRLVATIRRLAPAARRVVAVCSGAFFLGEAGLLRGRRAVSHWSACAALQARFPEARVDADAIFVRDGKVWTSAGVTAGMDLALALVEQDLGAALALEVARWLVMYLRRPGGQSQFSAPLAAQAVDAGPIESLIAWVRANLCADLSVPALARRVSMSERNFARVFVARTGQTPAGWVARVRLEAARSALEISDKPVKEIAAECGFGSAESLHHAFKRALRTSPLAYRARFDLHAGTA
jgi:transcriptional regulator GlxA family with amidase domain